MEFIGKLHPLIVHLPIGLIIAAFGLDLVFRKVENPLALKSVRFLIGLAAFTGILSSIFGYLLSISSGYDADSVSTHQWLGISFSIVALLFFFYRPKLSGKGALWFGWIFILSILTATGHFGGSLTHGENYLAESAPDFIKNILEDDKPPGLNKPLDSIVIFQDIVQPIMEQKCWYCHNSDKSKGRLNLETLAGWQKGGKKGDLIAPGDPIQSHLLQRIYLPSNDKKHMPPRGKEQLSAAEIAVLEWWISKGGDYNERLTNLDRNERVDIVLESYIGGTGGALELDLPDYDKRDLLDLQKTGVKIMAMAKESNLLEVRFRGDSLISDDQLTSLLSLDKNIVRIDFSFSGVTNDQLKTLSKLEQLNYLSLANTTIDDAGLEHLAELENLRVLNLHSSNITKASLPMLRSMTGLQKVFLFNTKISVDKFEEFAVSNSRLQVGY